jgi:hypothetical protein
VCVVIAETRKESVLSIEAVPDENPQDLAPVAQLAFFAEHYVAYPFVAVPAPKKLPCRTPEGDRLDPKDGDVLTIQFDVKINGLNAHTDYKRVKGAAAYTRTKRREAVYGSQVVEGTAEIVAHFTPE